MTYTDDTQTTHTEQDIEDAFGRGLKGDYWAEQIAREER
jgi:hypothetical protein